jgi:hypothetical protein
MNGLKTLVFAFGISLTCGFGSEPANAQSSGGTALDKFVNDLDGRVKKLETATPPPIPPTSASFFLSTNLEYSDANFEMPKCNSALPSQPTAMVSSVRCPFRSGRDPCSGAYGGVVGLRASAQAVALGGGRAIGVVCLVEHTS